MFVLSIMQNKKVLAVIPARYDSERFPGKLLSILDGKTVVFRVVSQVLKCGNVDDVVLATDDERIASNAASLPIEIVYARNSFRNGTERVASIASRFPTHDVIINIQGDEPFLSPSGLFDLVEALKTDVTTQIATLMSLKSCTDLSEHVVKVYSDEDDFAIGFIRHMPSDIECYSHIGVYGFQRNVLLKVAELSVTDSENEQRLEQLRWLENGYKIKMIRTEQHVISIDVPSDLSKAERYIKSIKSQDE